MSVTKTCLYCGMPFTCAPSNEHEKFCCRHCYHANRTRTATVEVKCEVCGRSLHRKRYNLTRNKAIICSTECIAVAFKQSRTRPDAPYTKSKRKGPDYSGYRTCKRCEKEFFGRPHQQFCSVKCIRDRQVLLCSNCGIGFERIGCMAIFPRMFCTMGCKREFEVGVNHPRWRDGATTANTRARRCVAYVEWRAKVFTRDDYTCRDCGQRGGRLNAHHIFEFHKYPHLRYVVANGRTLCEECHDAVFKREEEYRRSLLTRTPFSLRPR